jgi:hypothetical protein
VWGGGGLVKKKAMAALSLPPLLHMNKTESDVATITICATTEKGKRRLAATKPKQKQREGLKVVSLPSISRFGSHFRCSKAVTIRALTIEFENLL